MNLLRTIHGVCTVVYGTTSMGMCGSSPRKSAETRLEGQVAPAVAQPLPADNGGPVLGPGISRPEHIACTGQLAPPLTPANEA